MSARRIAPVLFVLLSLTPLLARADDLPAIAKVSAQPLRSHVKQLVEALDYVGAPLPADARAALADAANLPNDQFIAKTQSILDPLCLISIQINPESRVKLAAGPAAPQLAQNGWRQFLVKVHNEAGVTAEFKAQSPNIGPLAGAAANTLDDRWLDLQLFNQRPLNKNLSGAELEYRIVQLYSRDAGKLSATLAFNVGQGTQDIGFRNDVTILFNAQPANDVKLSILDENDKPTTASLVFRDAQGHVYPSQAKRLAPDFAFHPQVYRSNGESLKLPAGKYTLDYSRGPEYLPGSIPVEVSPQGGQASIKLQRWIDPSLSGWWSGDHHIHAAGCAHYTKPTEGVLAKDMFLHCVGEDLKVGANLTWGPCFDYQKQFFTGAVDKVSTYPYLLRYDVEVSGFGSHRTGHLCLLRLKEQMYPGGDSDKHWPTLGLNTLRWAKKQGAVCGPAHSGWGLQVQGDQLPNYTVPPYDGIGANEYVMDVTHRVPGPDNKPVPAVDFISTVDTPYVWELNMWYHTLNCGYRTRISGETDFPCIYGERVGLGRSYVKLDGKLDYDAWCEGIRNGRNYVSEGHSHLMDFQADDRPVGTDGSELQISNPKKIRLSARCAAYLPVKSDPGAKTRPYTAPKYWDIERARIGDSRNVKVEAVVNGYPVASTELLADGQQHPLDFEVSIDRSSWVALRILPSSHTNPIFILVDGKPVRASRRSADWCLKGVDQCWSQKQRFIAPAEMEDARAAYEHARAEYRRILGESEVD